MLLRDVPVVSSSVVGLTNEEKQFVLVLAPLGVQLFQDLRYRRDELVLGEAGVLRLELLYQVRRCHRLTHQVTLHRLLHESVAATHDRTATVDDTMGLRTHSHCS